MPRMFNCVPSAAWKALSAGLFVVGAVVIGLVLLEHEHCSVQGDHGHGHR